MSFRALLREPLVHFLLIGLALFIVYGSVSPADSNSLKVVVTQDKIDDLSRQFQTARNRRPTSIELDGLVENHVRDEIHYREGLALGLDKDDAVIKRRIRQKYDLIAEEALQGEASDADLVAFMKQHPDRFLRPTIVSFDQIFFDPAQTSPESVEAVKALLRRGVNVAGLGQPSMLPRQVSRTAIGLVAREFGDGFAEKVGQAPVGQWVGPIASGFGVHLLRVTARDAPVAPPLNEIRSSVMREWESDRRARASDQNYREARGQYEVVIEDNAR